MEDRSSLLKLYNDRTSLLNKGFFTQGDFYEYLSSKSFQISDKLASVLISFSMVSNTIRPELLIESILQYLKGKRNYSKEAELIQGYFTDCGVISWENFRENFMQDFSEIYENNEISRILQLVKRFGLEKDNSVTYDYVYQLVKTSNIKTFDVNRTVKKFEGILSKVFLKMSWRMMRSAKKIIKRKPLEIISNSCLSILQEPQEKKKGIVEEKSGEMLKLEKKIEEDLEKSTKSNNLRNKLFFQAYKNFSVNYSGKLLKECFCIIKNPYRYRNPFIHRSVFKIYLRLKTKAQKILSNCLLKWSDVPSYYIDFVKTGSLPCIQSYENSVNFSKQLNILNLSNGLKEKNSKILGALLATLFKEPVKRILKVTFDCIYKDLSKSALKIMKISLQLRKKIMKKYLDRYYFFLMVQKQIDNYQTKLNYQAKKNKFLISNKAKKFGATRIEKILKKYYFRSKLYKFKENSLKFSQKFSQSFSNIEKRRAGSVKNSTLSKSFVDNTHDFSPKVTSKFDTMKFSVKKIKYHHGLEKLWVVSRKIFRKSVQKSLLKSIQKWRSVQKRLKMNINLPKNKFDRPTHVSQFSFRDKEEN